jgi:hypothetical protein
VPGERSIHAGKPEERVLQPSQTIALHRTGKVEGVDRARGSAQLCLVLIEELPDDAEIRRKRRLHQHPRRKTRIGRHTGRDRPPARELLDPGLHRSFREVRGEPVELRPLRVVQQHQRVLGGDDPLSGIDECESFIQLV